MSRSTHMVRPAKKTRRLTVQRWSVSRWDEVLGTWVTFELTCEAGTFYREYRMLGRLEDTLSSDAPEIRLFDPLTDTWTRTLLEEWTEVMNR